MTTFINCPNCGERILWGPEALFRPFCSDRCKKIDMGAWATEKYTIPSETTEDPARKNLLPSIEDL
ncbi:DNA gyrase inhibitor YacG [Candidatus Pandoraea novymonadis]|uniref:DNA gyrase inhibitor YacG n=1 Tax=Candidatus Pandoraea novymonadis TaxID=1808959 RepID=UPI000D059419|nr:DNA gyrase inhibitor YacG [Candidatus Pandoraea novymonadis]